MLSDPFIRDLDSPLTTAQLQPLDPRCEVIQFGSPLTEPELESLADFCRAYPTVPLRVYGFATVQDLEFLRFFPFLRGFQVDVWKLKNLEGLRFLPSDLEFLGLGATLSKALSLGILKRFPHLKDLFVEGHTKDAEAIGLLRQLETLTLRSVTLPNLNVLRPLDQLQRLAIKLGGTRDLRMLPEIGRIRYLELWMIRGLVDVDVIQQINTLRFVFLQALRNVTTLPSFRALRNLRRLHIENMKGIKDLRPASEAPALDELVVVNMRHLGPEDFRPFLGHPTLKAATILLGSQKKNRASQALLGLPQVESTWEKQLTE